MELKFDANALQALLPSLSLETIERLRTFCTLLLEWNQRVNLISRKDAEEIFERHLLHSLTIERLAPLPKGAEVVDVGTGGGFPGLPLAIIRPDVRFTLIDSTSKKIAVIRDIIMQMGLENADAYWIRAEECDEKFDFILGRAVTELPAFVKLTRKLIRCRTLGDGYELKNGILYLKGGDLTDEFKALKLPHSPIVLPLNEILDAEYFETKVLVYLPLCK